MTPERTDRWLKRIWLVNGIVLLALPVVGLAAAAFTMLGNWRGDRAVAVAATAPDEGAATADRVRAVRFDVPVDVRGTATRLVLVRNGASYLAGSDDYPSSGSGKSQREGPIVNVAFLPADGAAGRLLLDRPAYLSDVSWPGEPYDRADSLQTWISYEVALEDTNGDGSLDDEDRKELYVSDLEGHALRRVLPAGWRLEDYESLGDGRTLVVTALAAPKPGEQWDERRALERAFRYDVPAGRIESFAALDSLVVEAGRLLGGAPAAARR